LLKVLNTRRFANGCRFRLRSSRLPRGGIGCMARTESLAFSEIAET
jgi:hypothetical protein